MSVVMIRILVIWSLLLPVVSEAVTPMIAAHGDYNVLLKSDGTVMAWGSNRFGQIGDGTYSTTRLNPVQVLTGALAVAASNGQLATIIGGGGSSPAPHTLALMSDGTVMSWGYNGHGELGDGTGTLPYRLSPAAVPVLASVAAVGAGATHSVALLSNGIVVAWGGNNVGQLGDGTTTDRLTPVVVSGLTGVSSVSTGHHTLALKSDGTVVAWGLNDKGQIGDATTTNRVVPIAVPGLTGVIAVSAGESHSLALKSDGTVMAWGFNGTGQLGNETLINSATPVSIPGLTGVIAVAAAVGHSLALKSDGTVMAWGSNSKGQLGNGTVIDSLIPLSVPGVTGVIAVAGGSSHSVALKSDGNVMAWGNNMNGELGIGTNYPYSFTSAVTVIGVIKADQTIGTISFSPTYYPVALTVAFSTLASATATSGLAVSFTSLTPTICTVATVPLKTEVVNGTYRTTYGSSVTAITGGTCTIAANQAGDPAYTAAPQVTQSFTVGKASQTLTFGPAPTFGAGGTGPLSATASSGLTATFSSTTPNVCTVTASTVSALTAGTCTIAADQAGDPAYQAAPRITAAISVAKSSPNDCLFNWAQSSYPTYFPGKNASQTSGAYYFRFYSQSSSYIAVNAGRVIYFGPLSGNTLMDLGPATTWYGTAGC